MTSRFSGTSGTLGWGGTVAAGDGADAAAEAGVPAGPSACAAVAVFSDRLSDFEPDAGAAVFSLALAGLAPARVFAAAATVGSVSGCASLCAVDGCVGASFFAPGSASDFAGGVVGIMEAILSFSTST